MNRSARILLISNSTVYGRDSLDHAETEIKNVLGPRKAILFVPFALFDREAYAAKAQARFAKMGLACESVHQVSDPNRAIEETDALFIGGGNTFRLLKALQDLNLIEPIRRCVRGGTPYLGSSAGSNVAGPTIKTTKDMPIVQPRSFDSLGLVPFQISPHYQDPDPNSTHMGETQEERILQFLEENETPVLGMREGAWVRAEEGRVVLGGNRGARIFRRGESPVEKTTGDEISSLIGAPE